MSPSPIEARTYTPSQPEGHQPYWDEHKTFAAIENANFLYHQGYTRSQVARRLGITKDNLEIWHRRYPDRFTHDGLQPAGQQETLC